MKDNEIKREAFERCMNNLKKFIEEQKTKSEELHEMINGIVNKELEKKTK